MATITDYLNQLDSDKESLYNALDEHGKAVSSTDTFTILVPKVQETFNTELDNLINVNGELTPSGFANKWNYLKETKNKIRTSLNNLGAGLEETDSFRNYVTAIDNLFTSFPTVSAEGTSLTINDTKKGLLRLTLKGNQPHQLLHLDNKEFSDNGIDCSCVNGVITLNGTSTAQFSVDIPLLANIPANVVRSIGFNNPVANSNITIYELRSSSYYLSSDLSQINAKKENYTRTNEVVGLRITVANLQTLDNFVIKPMCNLGSSVLPYEDYIDTSYRVTGNNTITITNSDSTESQTYNINLGTLKLNDGDYFEELTQYPGEWNIKRANGTTYYVDNASLKNQLNTLKNNAMSYDTQTNISQTNAEMPFIINAISLKEVNE